MNYRTLASVVLLLSTAQANAAERMSLDCFLEENSDGKTRELFTIDFDARTIRVHTVDYNGDAYRWQRDVTYPATISRDEVAWSEPSDSGPSAYVAHRGPKKWTITVRYAGQHPETADCEIWRSAPPPAQ